MKKVIRFRKFTKRELKKARRIRYSSTRIADGAIDASYIRSESFLRHAYESWYLKQLMKAETIRIQGILINGLSLGDSAKTIANLLADYKHTTVEIQPGLFEHTYTIGKQEPKVTPINERLFP